MVTQDATRGCWALSLLCTTSESAGALELKLGPVRAAVLLPTVFVPHNKLDKLPTPQLTLRLLVGLLT